MAKNTKEKDIKKEPRIERDPGYFWSMSEAPHIGEANHWFQMLPIILFSAISILLVRMYIYDRPMDLFYWSNGETDQTDFFSHCKMVCILIAAVCAIVFILYRLCVQNLAIKKTYLYIPMAVYALFVLISYAASDYKQFALYGYNDRFEGTLALLAYMVVLFAIITLVNGENNIKVVMYALFVSAALLGILGVSQGTGHDFFRTVFGQKLITPNVELGDGTMLYDAIDAAAANGEQALKFTFQNKEIYQTVYNINYVSFYLTLLLPVVGLLFIRSVERWKEEAKWKPVVWGALFALLLYNLIGSASSGGFLGMGIVVLMALIVLNKKILRWWKPLLILIVITALIGGLTFDRWKGELGYAFKSTVGSSETTASEEEAEVDPEKLTGHLDYLTTSDDHFTASIDGVALDFSIDSAMAQVSATDKDGKPVAFELVGDGEKKTFLVDNEAFKNVLVMPAIDDDRTLYIILRTNNPVEKDWLFGFTDEGVYYFNDKGNRVSLTEIPAVGFEGNGDFGNGRGYIWSRTIPMMKDTVLLGHGADTYCLYFPHNDYVGKYNAGNFANVLEIIVDKPHNMYMGAWIGTGGISVLALLALFLIYIVQSIRIYFRKDFADMEFLDVAGVGIMLGIVGFLFTGLVDDSTVSVMPMFYTMLGLGVVINILQGQKAAE